MVFETIFKSYEKTQFQKNIFSYMRSFKLNYEIIIYQRKMDEKITSSSIKRKKAKTLKRIKNLKIKSWKKMIKI